MSVVAGTALFSLDPADYKIALKAADANLAAANLAAAKARQLHVNTDEKRQATSLKQGWTTQAAYDRILAGSSAASEQVAAASEEVKRTRNQLNYTKLSAPESGVVTSIAVEAGQVVALYRFD